MKHFILTVTFLVCMSLNGANALENNSVSKFGIAISNDAEKIAYSVNENDKTS